MSKPLILTEPERKTLLGNLNRTQLESAVLAAHPFNGCTETRPQCAAPHRGTSYCLGQGLLAFHYVPV